MKKLLFMLFVTAIVLAIGCQKEENYLTNQMSSNEEELFEEQIVSIDIDVEVIDGILAFKDEMTLIESLAVLDTLKYESRKAWESKIGFKSIRSIWEESMLNLPIDGNGASSTSYTHLLDHSGSSPRLRDYSILHSSILNEEGKVYVGEAIGSVRKNASYWVLDGDHNKLSDAINRKQTIEKDGIYVIEFRKEQEIEGRTCSENTLYSSITSVTEPYKMAESTLEYVETAYPDGSGTYTYTVDFRMDGWSYKRNCVGCNWKTDRSDHIFDWDFAVGREDNVGVITDSFSGNETAIDNQHAAVTINVDVVAGVTWSWIDNFGYTLEAIYTGTTYTTVEVSGSIIYECL